MSSGMKVEEKIARAYHRDLSWRKVLVSLEPDAHNNIIVRRKFANAYGWPVVKHLVDTHFGYTTAATTADAVEEGGERAIPINTAEAQRGNEVAGQDDKPKPDQPSTDGTPQPHSTGKTRVAQPLPPIRTDPNSGSGEENEDTVPEMTFSPVSASRLQLSSPDLVSSQTHAPHGHGNSHGSLLSGNGEELHRPTSSLSRASSMQSSARWTDRYFEEEDEDEDEGLPFHEHERERGGDRQREHAKESPHDKNDSGLKVDTMPAELPHGNVQSGQMMKSASAAGEEGKGGSSGDTMQPSA